MHTINIQTGQNPLYAHSYGLCERNSYEIKSNNHLNDTSLFKNPSNSQKPGIHNNESTCD